MIPAILSLAGPVSGFFRGPAGRTVLVVLAFFAWTAYQRMQAASHAREQCQNAQYEKTVTEITRQRDAAQAALDEAEKREAQTHADLDRLETESVQIVQDLQNSAGDACRIPADAIERLRNIR